MTKANNGKASTTDTLVTVRLLAARTREGRDAAITRTLESVKGYDYVTESLRAALALDMAADYKSNGGTLSTAEVADRYGFSKSQANRYIRAGKIVATHDYMRDAVLAAMTEQTPESVAALAPVLSLLAVIGRNGTDRPAPNAAEIESVALAPSDDAVAALDAAIDARPVVESSGEESGEGEGEESGEATPETLAERDATMIIEAFARLNGRDGAAALIPADVWQTLTTGYNVARDSRNAAARRTRKASAA